MSSPAVDASLANDAVELHNISAASVAASNSDSSITAPLMHCGRSWLSGDSVESFGESIETEHGPVYVVTTGAAPNSGKPYIITYHDMGLNFASNFQAFFNFHDMKLLLQSFTVLNVHSPGQVCVELLWKMKLCYNFFRSPPGRECGTIAGRLCLSDDGSTCTTSGFCLQALRCCKLYRLWRKC